LRAGSWEGLVHAEIAAGWPELYGQWRAGGDVPAGGDERPSEAGRRTVAALRRHAATAGGPGRTLVVVGHGAGLRAAVALGIEWWEGYRRLGNLGNGHWAEVVVPGDGDAWRLVRWNVPPG
jgi:probable phosphoglycerate mutase